MKSTWYRQGAQALVIGCVAVASVAVAQAPPVAYPAKGQSPQQQQSDTAECRSWASSQTGMDPSMQAAAPPPTSGPAVGGGERLAGAARGAVGGAVIGGIAGDAGQGAGIGAAAGTMAGGARARQNRREAQASQHAQTQSSQDAWARAFGACMSGRGYTLG